MAESAPPGVPDHPLQGVDTIAALAPGSQQHGHPQGELQPDVQQRVPGRGQRAAAAEELLSQQRHEGVHHSGRDRLPQRGQVLADQFAETVAGGGSFIDGWLHASDSSMGEGKR